MPKFVTPFNKGRRQSVYGGNETVECGICSQGVQYRNLQNHFNTKHGARCETAFIIFISETTY